jgi:hypothetical protein
LPYQQSEEFEMSHADRRHTPRVDAHSRLRAEIAPLGLEVHVVDFSLGGFRAECAAPFGPDSYDFRIWTTDGVRSELLRAKAVYSHRLGSPSDTPSYVTGFAFLDLRNPRTEARINGILDHVMSVLQVA